MKRGLWWKIKIELDLILLQLRGLIYRKPEGGYDLTDKGMVWADRRYPEDWA